MGGWRSCWPVYVGQCLWHCVPSVFGRMTVLRYRSRSCASASVLRMGQKCFGIVPVRQCFKIAFLQKVVLCQCLSVAHGSDMFYRCSSWPMSDIASLQGVFLCQCLGTLGSALKHRVEASRSFKGPHPSHAMVFARECCG